LACELAPPRGLTSSTTGWHEGGHAVPPVRFVHPEPAGCWLKTSVKPAADAGMFGTALRPTIATPNAGKNVFKTRLAAAPMVLLNVTVSPTRFRSDVRAIGLGEGVAASGLYGRGTYLVQSLLPVKDGRVAV